MGGPACVGTLLGKVYSVIDDDGKWVEDHFSDETFHLACPWHGWEFDISTGVCATDDHFKLAPFEVVQRGEQVYLVAP
jgi:nitrite reductase/ring-hydroxylating ferredoxin subunit